MKKLSAFLFCLGLASFTFAQAVQLSTLIPTNPSAVVDELMVIDSDGASNISLMNIGLSTPEEKQNEPFQTQTLQLTGTPQITGSVSAGRDLLIKEKLNFTQANIGEGNLFIPTASFPYVEAGTLKAKTINGPTDANNTAVSGLISVSGRDIKIDDVLIQKPFAKGVEIAKRHPVYLAKADEANKNKYHIYFPWSSFSPNNPTGLTRCNTNNNMRCTKASCNACTKDNPETYCYDVRSRSLPAVYNASGATFEKVGTAKFYCKPVEKYTPSNSNSSIMLSSTCSQYMLYYSKDSSVEGYTSASINFESQDISLTPVAANPITNDIFSIIPATPAQDSPTQETIDNIFAAETPAEMCHILCDGTCSDTYEYKFVIDKTDNTTSTLSKWSNIFAKSDYCANEDSLWPAGSGLNCKANEKILDIYALKCYTGSGELLRPAKTYYQQRKVLCRQYAHVYNNGSNNGESASVSKVEGKDFFFPDSDISYAIAYEGDTEYLEEHVDVGDVD